MLFQYVFLRQMRQYREPLCRYDLPLDIGVFLLFYNYHRNRMHPDDMWWTCGRSYLVGGRSYLDHVEYSDVTVRPMTVARHGSLVSRHTVCVGRFFYVT